MKRRNALQTLILLSGNIMAVSRGEAEQKGKPVFGSTDISKYRDISDVHGGAGTLKFLELLGSDIFETNFLFVHRAEIPPQCGIGEHIHRNMEEMFFVFNCSARFTVNGHTSELPAGSMVLCPKGSSHGIYNHTDKTLQWLNVAVSMEKGRGDSIDFNDDLTDSLVESPPQFLWTRFDPNLLKPAYNAHGGKGEILFRRMWDKESFKTNWEFVDHCVLPPGTSIGYHQHNMIEEVYYLISGRGRVTVNNTTWDVKAGDAIPCTLHDSHGLYNNSNEDIILLVVSCAVKKGVYDINNWGDDLTDQ